MREAGNGVASCYKAIVDNFRILVRAKKDELHEVIVAFANI